jgi:hypothetical protein
MQSVKALAAIFVILALGLMAGFTQQQPTVFKLAFKGTAYQRDDSGNIVGVPLTEQTLLAARTGGNTQNLALAYILDGNERGDTIEIVDTTTRARQGFMFGLWFGDDRTMQLGRTALTNAALTEIRRVDQVFTLDNSTYSSQNGHGVGTSFVVKRFVRDTAGNTQATIDVQIQWMVNPWGDNRWAKICHGTFVSTQPLF